MLFKKESFLSWDLKDDTVGVDLRDIGNLSRYVGAAKEKTSVNVRFQSFKNFLRHFNFY